MTRARYGTGIRVWCCVAPTVRPGCLAFGPPGFVVRKHEARRHLTNAFSVKPIQHYELVVIYLTKMKTSVLFTQIVNFVGVQCEVEEEAQHAFRERLRKIPLPEELMRDASDDGAE